MHTQIHQNPGPNLCKAVIPLRFYFPHSYTVHPIIYGDRSPLPGLEIFYTYSTALDIQ